MKFVPVVVVSPWIALALTFWKPLLIGLVVLYVLVAFVLFPASGSLAREGVQSAVVPTMPIPETWRASLTQAALPKPTPRP